MKCTVTREDILEHIVSAEKSVGKSHALPILSCVLLEVKNKKMYITATNLEVGVRYEVAVKDVEDGKVAVAGSVLAHVVNSLPSGTEFTISSDDGYLSIQSSEGVSRVALQDTEEFPTLPKVEDGTNITLEAKALYGAISGVVYCASNSTIKPELSSVFVHPDGGVLIATATDSFRLAEKRVSLKNSVNSEPFLIPAKSTTELLRALEHATGDITLTVSDHQLSLMLPDIYITLRLVSGTFPDYAQIIPKDFASEATVLAHDFERALRKASAFSDQFNQTTLTLSPKNKKFTVHTQNDTVGETTDSISAVLEGEDLTIKFNQRYLLDSLHSIATDSIVVRFAGQSQPAVITPVGDSSLLYLVMPMNR